MSKKNYITAVVANRRGDIFDLEGFAAVGMAGSKLVPLAKNTTTPLPHGSELMLLPDRKPILYNIHTGKFDTLHYNPYRPEEVIFPVAAFNSPGYLITYISAYIEEKHAGYLPLFSYGAVGWGNKDFRSAAICVDREKRQDLRYMKQEDIITGIESMRRKMPGNRLRKHLERCALDYGCPAGKNFFLGRYEAPLPTSRQCNAECLGCISLQKTDGLSPCQERIAFTPSSEEISEVALEHIMNVKKAVVSFGQGCEGDPIMAADVIEPAIRMIRASTRRGTINMNTNGSKPRVLQRLFDAGLDSIRISINSVREDCYNAYFQPKGYRFSDVTDSIDLAIQHKKFVSINYLNLPGFIDASQETDALVNFIKKYRINYIQWRNLNYDPIRYYETMNRASFSDTPIGVKALFNRIKQRFPDVKHGYFNPPKEKWSR